MKLFDLTFLLRKNKGVIIPQPLKHMKKTIPSIVALFLGLGYSSLAGQTPAPLPGTVGSVTIALATQYEVGGFSNGNVKSVGKLREGSYNKIVTNTATAYKEYYSSVIKIGKYTNQEFIADLVSAEKLASPASQWRLVYVSIYSQEIDGVFAVNKANTQAVYLGGYVSDSGLPVNLRSNNGHAYNETDVNAATRVNFGEYTTQVRSGSYTGLETYSITLNTYTYAYLTGLASFQESYSRTWDYVHEKYTSTRTIGGTTFSNIIGDDDDNMGMIFTGSITFGRLYNQADTKIFQTAYNYYYNG